jgi:hypothetical protein
MFAHNKSGIAYRDGNRRSKTVVNHKREPHQQLRLLPRSFMYYQQYNAEGTLSLHFPKCAAVLCKFIISWENTRGGVFCLVRHAVLNQAMQG